MREEGGQGLRRTAASVGTAAASISAEDRSAAGEPVFIPRKSTVSRTKRQPEADRREGEVEVEVAGEKGRGATERCFWAAEGRGRGGQEKGDSTVGVVRARFDRREVDGAKAKHQPEVEWLEGER